MAAPPASTCPSSCPAYKCRSYRFPGRCAEDNCRLDLSGPCAHEVRRGRCLQSALERVEHEEGHPELDGGPKDWLECFARRPDPPSTRPFLWAQPRRCSTVIGGEHPFARRIDTQVGGTPTLRVDYVQELQAAVRLNSDMTEPFLVPLKFGSSQRIARHNHTCRGTSCLMKSRPASRSGDSRRASLATLGPGRRDRHTTFPGSDSDSARLRRRRQSESRDRRAL